MVYGGVWWCMAVYAAAWWLKPVGGCCAGGVRLYAVTLWLMITCIYAHVSDGVKWHRPRAHGGAWWCTVVYAALAGWAAGRLGVWWCMDCVCSACRWCRDCVQHRLLTGIRGHRVSTSVLHYHSCHYSMVSIIFSLSLSLSVLVVLVLASTTQ